MSKRTNELLNEQTEKEQEKKVQRDASTLLGSSLLSLKLHCVFTSQLISTVHYIRHLDVERRASPFDKSSRMYLIVSVHV